MTDARQLAAPKGVLWALIIGAVGVIGGIGIAFVDPGITLQGWLAAAFALSAMPIGTLGLLLLHALAGGPWGPMLEPVLQASLRMLPLFALAFIPIIATPSLVYVWAASDGAADANIAAKAAYLDPHFFAVRTLVYFAIWMALAALLDARNRNRAAGGRLTPAIGMIVYAITVSIAAIELAMSVDPRFSSSVFGLLVGIADMLAALAFAIVLVAWVGPPAQRSAGEDHRVRDALAGLLAAGVLLWAYLSFMQYLIVWSGDIPADTGWYLDRVAGAWRLVPWALGLLLGALPVIALALPAGRRSLARLAGIAALIFVMRFVEAVWLVLPSFAWRGWLQPVALLSATVGLGGLGLASVLWYWERGSRRTATAEMAQHG